MTKDEYTKRLEEILKRLCLDYATNNDISDTSLRITATNTNKQDAITAIQQLNEEAIGQTDIQTRGITQSKDNQAYWTKSTRVDFELRQELKAVIGVSNERN